MTEKIGLKIVDLLHNITQSGYTVSFNEDFNGMIRIDYTNEFDPEFYKHEHLGCPDCERIVLEKQIITSLTRFTEEKK